jgi:hypothetical protein
MDRERPSNFHRNNIYTSKSITFFCSAGNKSQDLMQNSTNELYLAITPLIMVVCKLTTDHI